MTNRTKQLPVHPSLDQLRRQAKDTLRARRAEGEKLSLSLAQLLIAREYGFESWPKLKHHVETLGLTFEQKLKLLVQSVMSGRLFHAKYLLKNEPKLATYDIGVACMLGDFASVDNAVKARPSVTKEKVGIKAWEPLLYVSFSHFKKESDEVANNMLKIAKLLLENGADANSYFVTDDHEEGSDDKMPALYGPSGVTNFPELAELLLKSGANPNDRESLYHAAEFVDGRCLEILLRSGAQPHGEQAQTLHHALDFDNFAAIETILKAGSDPNFSFLELGQPHHHAIIRGRDGRTVDLLLKHGASATAVDKKGRTPIQLARRYGNLSALGVLRNHVSEPEMSDGEEFIAACARADRTAAKQMLVENSIQVESLSVDDSMLLPEFASLGKIEAVRLMLDLGFNIDVKGAWGGTAVHQAAWHGLTDMLDLLIARGADLEILNDYGGTALGTALFAPVFWKVHDDSRHAEIVESLIEAGAKVLPHMLNSGTEGVAEVLKAYANDPS